MNLANLRSLVLSQEILDQLWRMDGALSQCNCQSCDFQRYDLVCWTVTRRWLENLLTKCLLTVWPFGDVQFSKQTVYFPFGSSIVLLPKKQWSGMMEIFTEKTELWLLHVCIHIHNTYHKWLQCLEHKEHCWHTPKCPAGYQGGVLIAHMKAAWPKN